MEMNEIVDLITAGTVTSTTKGLAATNNYYGKTANYYANQWPISTDNTDIIVV